MFGKGADGLRDTFERLLGLCREVGSLGNVIGILDWDQQCYMPPGGAGARGEELALLTRIVHEKFTSKEMGDLLGKVEEWAHALGPDSFESACVRALRRDYDKAVKIPPELAAEMSRAASAGLAAWIEARRANDFSIFAPKLQRNLELAVQRADALGYGDTRYDALLDLYEPGARAAAVDALFERLKAGLVPLVHAVAARIDRVRADFLVGGYDEEKQWNFGMDVLRAMGFDFQHGRQDRSEHPFTNAFTPTDVRLTTRFGEHFGTALFGTMHEGGHGLYEQGIPAEWANTPVGTAASFGVHESQSRLWENVIGRSLAFWSHFFPRLQELFPVRLSGIDLDTFYRAINEAKPSLIRVEADELTYNLHIFLRFDLEKRLVSGDLSVADLPEAWNAGMRELMGLTPPDDVSGVMQDVHWSQGMIGYFPSYALGNVMSMQLYERALADRPSIPAEIERGDLNGVLDWMRTHVHRLGATLTGLELMERVTGRALDPDPYLHYLKEKYSEIYGL